MSKNDKELDFIKRAGEWLLNSLSDAENHGLEIQSDNKEIYIFDVELQARVKLTEFMLEFGNAMEENNGDNI